MRKKNHKIAPYPRGSCGRVMSQKMVVVKSFDPVDEVIAALRGADPSINILYIYVVDEEARLVGVAPLHHLLRERGHRPVGEMAKKDPVFVYDTEDREEAARKVSRHKFLAIPVVDHLGKLLGIITVDEVLDIMKEEATEDIYRLAGLPTEERIHTPLTKSLPKRLGWMVFNLFTAFLAAWVVGWYKDSIVKVVSLAIFMPVIAGMGGNGGIQALTVITRSLALGEIRGKTALLALSKEIGIALVVGLATGFLTGIVGYWVEGNIFLGLILWLAMIANLLVAGLAGCLIPLGLRMVGQDPALGSGVIVTTFTDVFGFMSFLGLATLFLHFLV